ncbi:MAG TPA: GYDIA family GHMP kinase [Williamwhitmania sp.]|nr:GYDIA family GHMP kinase [Williamwhitmania sp.]
MTKLRANAKLLLTGEYLVLLGAKAIALPLRFGQELTIKKGDNQHISWDSEDINGCWFSASFNVLGEAIDGSSREASRFVSTILRETELLSPGFLNRLTGQKVIVTADFDLSWGLGSSSSLISLVAQLADVDPFMLHRKVSAGSGYDVIAAQQSCPFLFQLVGGSPEHSPVALPSFFSKHLFFAYLGKKQETATNVSQFLSSSATVEPILVNTISDISLRIPHVSSVVELCQLMVQHEAVISKILGIDSIKKASFPDFNGCTKSLGAWGGDFALFCSEEPESYVRAYIEGKGLSPLFRFDEIVLKYD